MYKIVKFCNILIDSIFCEIKPISWMELKGFFCMSDKLYMFVNKVKIFQSQSFFEKS